MTDPTPSVSEALTRCDFECPTAALTIRDHIESLQRELAEARADRDEWLQRAAQQGDKLQSAESALAAARRDAERLDYIERTFSGMTNRERYLPVQMIWGTGSMGRTLREACDKYMKRDAAIGAPHG